MVRRASVMGAGVAAVLAPTSSVVEAGAAVARAARLKVRKLETMFL